MPSISRNGFSPIGLSTARGNRKLRMRSFYLSATLTFVLVVALAGCTQDDRAPFVHLELNAQPVPLLEAQEQPKVGRLLFRSGFQLTANNENFGGLSGLECSLDGSEVLAISDRGYWLKTELITEPNGTVSGLKSSRLGPLRDQDGSTLDVQDRWDSEEIVAWSPDAYVVTFEHDHRTYLYPLDDQSLPTQDPRSIPFPQEVLAAEPNKGMETATRLPGDRLLVLSEGLLDSNGDRIGWIGSDELATWDQVTFASWQDLQPTSATTLPDGRIVLLERAYSPEKGNRIRISEFSAAELEPGARITSRELAFLAAPMTLDNMEAVASSQGPEGETFLYLLSDDNFSTKQRTLFLQFELLPEEPSTPGPQESDL